ncbi:MAG: hypothetical protein HY855_14015 [Burkholderiales bacterium]|nr:hypothetical protein [Burkholderiales bacterium]
MPTLIVPFAGPGSEAGRQALLGLPLPNLQRLLARLSPGIVNGGDEYTLSPPHERALAYAMGWRAADGALPFAARVAASIGLPLGEHAWGLLTPVHLQVSTERIILTDPQALELDEAGSRALLDAVRPLLESEGFLLHWAGPLQWLAAHPVFDRLATASLDRVIGRHIDPWLPKQPEARTLRRVQNEAQMLLHGHPLNEAREAAGLPPVNSFWVSACGRLQVPVAEPPAVDDRLRRPALNEDWAAWREAWAALDAGPLAQLARQRGPVRLVLCGERVARTLETQPLGLWKRLRRAFRRPSAQALLESL